MVYTTLRAFAEAVPYNHYAKNHIWFNWNGVAFNLEPYPRRGASEKGISFCGRTSFGLQFPKTYRYGRRKGEVEDEGQCSAEQAGGSLTAALGDPGMAPFFPGA